MTREHNLAALKRDQVFDLLVVGGGATGCGIAVDAAQRGLMVALLEMNDLAEGTSGRSTKLVHGGVRYLEKAVKQLDKAQYALVREGLHERGLLLKNAPHLSNRLRFVVPLYRWLDLPVVFAGLKLYDLLAGKMHLGHSRLLSRTEVLKCLPLVKAEGLKGGVCYCDGQFNDARMAVALAKTAAEEGALIANHVEVTSLCKEGGRVVGVGVKDRLTGEHWQVRARGVINATGPFADRLRRFDDPATLPLVTVSSGVHIVLDQRFAATDHALMIPKTEDGRVLFVIPWQGHALVGTTDDPAHISEHPRVTEQEIDYLLRHLAKYLKLGVVRDDIKATWSGLRPLVADPQQADTSSLLRDFLISVSGSGLLTIVGGKWTSYRRMAEAALDRAIAEYGFMSVKPCRSDRTVLAGGASYSFDGAARLCRDYGIDSAVGEHLNRSYGDRAAEVAKMKAFIKRLHPCHPYLEAEVIYVAEQEFAVRAIDVLARRMPLALLDSAAAKAAVPRVVELMAGVLNWDQMRCAAELELANERLKVAL